MQKRGTLWMAALLALLALLALAALAPDAALAEAVKINETNFPDENFRDYVLTEIDTSGDGSLSDTEIATVTMINVSSEGITDLTGIEHFTALTDLYCSSNQLTTLDVSGNTQLTSLDCSSNQLTALDVSKNTNLTALDCSSNNLTKLDVSGCTALKRLFCDGNQLTELNVSSNTELTSLYCFNNNLTALDVSKNTALQRLDCSGNNLTKLDVSGCADLKTLYCSNNALTALNVSGYRNLRTLHCSDNALTALNVSGCTNLRALDCSNNALTALNVSGLNLDILDCSGQTPELEVDRAEEAGNWSVDLSKAIVGWDDKVTEVGTTTAGANLSDGKNVSWSRGRVEVSYIYNTGYNNQTMDVTLTLIPKGASDDTSVSTVTVGGIAGDISDTTITVKLPSGTGLPTDASQITITPTDPAAVASTPTTTDGGKTWTFTVTAEDGQTTRTYTLCVLPAYTVTVTSDDGEGSVTIEGAQEGSAWEGDTITLTATPNDGYVFDRWEVTEGGVTIENNTFAMPANNVAITAKWTQDAPDLPDIQPQEGTQAYTGVQGVTHLSLSQGTVVFTLPDLAGTEGVVWKSSKPKVVSIDPQTGEAQLKKSGTATLTATLPDGTTITQKVNVHKKDFAQPDTIRLQTKVDGKWTDVPEEGIVVVPKKSGQKSVPTRLVGDGGKIVIESVDIDPALATRSGGNPAPVKIKKRSLTDGQTTTLVIRANGQEFTLPITIDSTAKDLYPSEIQSILQQEDP